MSNFINKNEEPETFLISLQVRDKDNKIFETENGIKVTEINFEKTVHTWEQLEYQMKILNKSFNAITPKDSKINLFANVFNSISNTFMCMASYYGSEERFVKH